MQAQWWGYHEVVGALKPYFMPKNLFERFTFTGGGNTKALGTSAYTHLQALTPQLLSSNTYLFYNRVANVFNKLTATLLCRTVNHNVG